MSRSSTNEEPAPLLKAISNLCAMTNYSISSEGHIKQAFLLGLWHESFPEYMLANIERTYLWTYPGFHAPDQLTVYDDPYVNLQKFQFISETGDSWHQCYRDLRERRWRRLKVYREGGRLQYLLHNHRLGMPEGYQDIHLILDISISTCVPVKVGTKVVDVFETRCEDFVDIAEDQPNPNEEFETLVADILNAPTDNISEPRCDHGNLSGCCSQSDCSHFMGHDDPDPTLDPFKDSIPF